MKRCALFRITFYFQKSLKINISLNISCKLASHRGKSHSYRHAWMLFTCLPYPLDKVQINCTSRSLLKPEEEILKTCTYFLSSIRQLSLPRISSPSRKIKKLSAKKSCRKYYRCTADTGSWLKNVIITTKTFAVYILSSRNISTITANLTKKIPKLYS